MFGRRLPLGDVLVACVFERLLGYVAIGRRTPFTSNSHIGVIRSIVVHSEARHRGVGRRLLVAAEAEARRRGFRALRLTVMASNEAARALYRAAGYEELGRYPDEFKVEEGYVDDIFLGKRLEVNA